MSNLFSVVRAPRCYGHECGVEIFARMTQLLWLDSHDRWPEGLRTIQIELRNRIHLPTVRSKEIHHTATLA